MSPALSPHLRAEIDRLATRHHLAPGLVEAMVVQESSGDPWAWNPEPRYRWLWNLETDRPFRALKPVEIHDETPPPDFPRLAGDRDQEWWGQQASWGLLQLMGALARELGFRGPYLSQLCEPSLNLDLGCRHVARLVTWADGNLDQALAAYNAGKGGWRSAQAQQYVRLVHRAEARLLRA